MRKGRKNVAPRLPLPSPPSPPRRALPAWSSADVKLAAVAVALRVRPRAADMPPSMQERAFRRTRSLVEAAPSRRRPNLTLLALALKKVCSMLPFHDVRFGAGAVGEPADSSAPCMQEFDALYGPAWHCVVGRSFGSYVTHTPGGFVYFSLDGGDDANLSLLLFQTRLQPL